ncbi:hypothetical protein ARMGADRAFT_585312 [Armillaria gallica]|uniref:Uncharacterized protein n=1 Tax=Armillaria gallica TaxID=47427 RepID=A0A2H3E4H2_ARMGA|nr:hypothetical protein ARMGADRAFT_585312 [Armillaria gallica]
MMIPFSLDRPPMKNSAQSSPSVRNSSAIVLCVGKHTDENDWRISSPAEPFESEQSFFVKFDTASEEDFVPALACAVIISASVGSWVCIEGGKNRGAVGVVFGYYSKASLSSPLLSLPTIPSHLVPSETRKSANKHHHPRLFGSDTSRQSTAPLLSVITKRIATCVFLESSDTATISLR